MAVNRVQRFQPIASDAKHDRIFGRNLARRNEFLGHADGDTAGGLGKDALGFGEQLDGLANLVITYVVSTAAGFATAAN